MIGSGYHEKPDNLASEFFHIWIRNIMKYDADNIIVICDSGCRIPDGYSVEVREIPLDGNLGYCGDLLHDPKRGHFPGGPAVLMALAALAYIDEADLFYHEQDCLSFGDCLGHMYKEIFNGGIVFGRNRQKVRVENCMFLLKHEFIPEFLATYAASEPETKPQSISENKFERWMNAEPTKWRYHTIPGGRDRPLPFKAATWYGQKFTEEEMATLREMKLI